ncbi:HAD hydrolase family protein [Chloracidobacterium validum]|uniref:HAD hydrolase family protein n=2 Tax=Chloracidobacterium validum TaxID=2821543 RepID=A0ABX8BGF3_9BACT|nr:HAD hydrolase family protein [Chloracidobacterium validum]
MDCDGVLTEGFICLLPDGTEFKAFNSQDGHGLKLARRAGLRTGVITGRRSTALEQRARETGIEFLCQAASDKVSYLAELLATHGLAGEAVAFIGDDLPDVPVMQRVGLAVAVANAVPEVKQAAHYVTERPGGRGAVREVIELILKAQNKWNAEFLFLA